jgi:hypothetical protein
MIAVLTLPDNTPTQLTPCRIRNPFEDDTAADLMAKVRDLVVETSWPNRDLSLLKLGAILAKYPTADLKNEQPYGVDTGRENIRDIIERDKGVYGELRDIDVDEVVHLGNEVARRWAQPRALYFTIVGSPLIFGLEGFGHEDGAAVGSLLTFFSFCRSCVLSVQLYKAGTKRVTLNSLPTLGIGQPY